MQPIVNLLEQAFNQIDGFIGNINTGNLASNKVDELVQKIPFLSAGDKVKLQGYALQLLQKGEKELSDRITKAFENKGAVDNRLPPQHNQIIQIIPVKHFPILDATEKIVQGRIISPSSIQLDFCSDKTFTGYVKCPHKVKAIVETQSIDLDYLLIKIKQMTREEAKDYFNKHLNMVTSADRDHAFKILIRPANEERVKSIEVLVELLNLTEKNTNHYGILQNFAEKVFDLGKQKSIQDVEVFAFANNPYLTKKLLEHLINLLSENHLFSIELLKVLKNTLINSTLETLTEVLTLNELTRILKTVKVQFDNIDKGDIATTYIALSTFSDILDVMVDANVIKMEEEKIIKPLSDMLNPYSKHKDILINSQANYALQALVRIPSTSSAIRRIKASLKGFGSLYKMVANKDLSHLVDVYQNFKEAFQSGKDQENWYPEMRYLKLLVIANDLKEFQKEIKSEMKNTDNDLVVENAFAILYEQCHHSKIEWRKTALNLLGELFLDDQRWGNNKEIKKAILTKLLECASWNDRETALQAIIVLNAFSASVNNLSLQKKLLDGIKIPALPQEKQNVQEPPAAIDLVGEAKKLSYMTLEQRIWRMRETFLNKRALEPLNEVSYITTIGSLDTLDPSKKPFELHSRGIVPFLRDKDPVFLLLGDSGSGKSQYLRFLHEWLWDNWHDNEPIPLLINLNALKIPYEEAINKILKKSYGFSEDDCNNLKNNKSFIFLLDGYDELRSGENVYSLLDIGGWKDAKVIVTCRTQYLINNMLDYQRFFIPSDNDRLHEAVISPFNDHQIKNFCDELIVSKGLDANLLNYLNNHEGLKGMTRNPLLLSLILDVLPKIKEHLEKFPELNQTLLYLSIFDAFIEKFFKKQENCIKNPPLRLGDLKIKFSKYSREVALEMIKKGHLSLTYEEVMDVIQDPHFREDDERVLFSGIPLRKLGEDSYTFNHKSLMEYFVVRSILSTKLEISIVNLGKVLITEEIEIIKTLAEMVNSAPEQSKRALENNLLECIYDSRLHPDDGAKEIAAANAITILNAAAFNFSNYHFAGVRIRGANLSRAILYRTDFSGADLRKVKLHEAFLAEALLTGCKMEGVDFGQRSYLLHNARVNAISASKNTHKALSVSGKTAYLWDFRTCRKLLSIHHVDYLENIIFSSDEKGAYLKSSKGNILFWDLALNKLTYFLDQNQSLLSMDSNASGVIVGDSFGGAYLRDTQSRKILKYVFDEKFNKIAIVSVSLSKDGQKALLGCENGTLWLWDFTLKSVRKLEGIDKLEEKKQEPHEEKKEIDRQPLQITSLAFSQTTDDEAISADSVGTIQLWDLQTCKEKMRLFHPEGAKSVILSHSRAVSGGNDRIIRLWDTQAGRELQSFIGHNAAICSLAFTHDANWILSASEDNTIRQWNIGRKTTSYRAWEMKGLTSPESFAFSADGKFVYLFDKGVITDCIDLETYKRTPPPEMKIQEFNENIRVNVRIEGNIVSIYQEKISTKPIFRLKGHTGVIYSVVLSQDQKLLLSASADKTIRLWDLQSHKEILCLPHSHQVLKICFLENQKHFLAGDTQPSIKLWQIKDDEGNFAPSLLKSTSAALIAQNIKLEGVQGLTDENRLLLESLQRDIEFDKGSWCTLL